MPEAYVPGGGSSFESVTELRDAHTALMDSLDKELAGDTSEAAETAALARLEDQIRQFMSRGAATGAYIDETKIRTDCQVLINYWLSALTQAGIRVPGVRLAPFDEKRLPDLKDKPCPYVGLEAFKAEGFFFGREADTETLLSQVLDVPLVIVVGASGSGKSSLVMGGVLPALEKQQVISRILSPIIPGNAAIENLVKAVLQPADAGSEALHEAVARVRKEPAHLLDLLGGEEAVSTLITIDQFEELFTLSGDADRDILATSLAGVLDAGKGHRVILTMREEFRSKIALLDPLDPYRDKAWYSMRPMGYAGLRAAVERPAALVNLQFQRGVVDDLVKKVLGQPAALPLLQFTLRRLWENRDRNRITWEVYHGVGDPLNSLKNSADKFFDGLAQETQDEVKRILLELVRVDDLLEAYRQPIPMSSLLKAGKANTENVIELLSANDYVRVSSGGDDEGAVVEVKHEALVRNWPRLVSWIDEKRQRWRQRLAISQAAKRWADSGRPPAGLFTGWQLQEAMQLTDLDAIEREFIEDSDRAIVRIQKRKIWIPVGCLALLSLIIGSVWALDHFYWQERKRTWGVLESLEKMSPEDRSDYSENYLDRVAIYLWNKRTKRDLDILANILQEADAKGFFAPDVYQVTEWATVKSMTEKLVPDKDTKAVVTIESASGDELSEPSVKMAWCEFSKILRDTGIPIPATIHVEPGKGGKYPFRIRISQLNLLVGKKEAQSTSTKAAFSVQANSERAEGTGFAPRADQFKIEEKVRDIPVTFNFSEILLSDLDLDPLAINLLRSRQAEWGAREAFTDLELPGWWWVPRWTIPIWKAAQHRGFYPPEAAIAVHAIVTLNRDRQLLYSHGVVVGVLKQLGAVAPSLVRSACEASGGIGALTEKVRNKLAGDLSLTRMQCLLESLAKGGPRWQPAEVTINCDINHVGTGGESEWRNISEGERNLIDAINKQTNHAIAEAFKPDPPLRVYLAGNLVRFVATNSLNLDDEVQQRISDLRNGIERDYGLRVPGVRFIAKDELKENQFSVEINGRSVDEYTVRPGQELDDMMEVLKERLVRFGPAWVGIQQVTGFQEDLPAGLRDWLSQKYTTAELKSIMREVLVPGGSNFDDLEPGEIQGEMLPGATLAHLPWLMRSLAFWIQICEPSDYACLGDGLRRTQLARINREKEAVPPRESRSYGSHLAPLAGGRFQEAETSFRTWLSAGDPEEATGSFLQAYAAARPLVEYTDRYALILPSCSPEPGKIADSEWMVRDKSDKLSRLLEQNNGRLTKPQLRRLELCLASSQTLSTQDLARVSQSIYDKFDEADSKQTDWTAGEKYWLIYLALRVHLVSEDSRDKAPPLRLPEIREMLREVVHDLPLADAESAFFEVSDMCANQGAGAWCGEMLGYVAEGRPESYWIPVNFAYSLSQLNWQGARSALKLLERAEANLGGVEKDKVQGQKAWLSYIRGLAHQTLGDLGEDSEFDEAIRFFKKSVNDNEGVEGGPGPDLTYGALAGVFFRIGNQDEALKVIEAGAQVTDESEQDQLRAEKFRMFLFRGQFDKILELLGDKSDAAALFMRSCSRAFAENSLDRDKLDKDVQDFFATSHDYRDYIRLIYHWKLMREGRTKEAKAILDERWRGIALEKSSSWPALLEPDRGGYMRVWREKLIGYYLGQVSESDICDVLKEPLKFDSSPYSNAEGSREGFLCEWYFYNALLQSISGDPATRIERMSESLRQAVATKQTAFIEYQLARNLLKRIEEGETFSLQNPEKTPAEQIQPVH